MHYGIDVGGTKIEIAVFDSDLNRLWSSRIDTPTESYASFIDSIVELVDNADNKFHQLGTVGIGLPGINDADGLVISANVPCIDGRTPGPQLIKRLGREVVFINDCQALAISESNGGAGINARYVLGLIIGTGVAGGFCVDRNLVPGSNGAASEYGHIQLPAILQQRYQLPLRQCGCGLIGCMEQYISGPGLLWLSTHLGGQYQSVADLILCLRNDDLLAKKIFNTYTDCLSYLLATLTMVLDPDLVVLGGGLSNIDELYLQLPERVQGYLFAKQSTPTIVPPRFGDSSGVRGAALLAMPATEKQ